jgi:hypothetical protein
MDSKKWFFVASSLLCVGAAVYISSRKEKVDSAQVTVEAPRKKTPPNPADSTPSTSAIDDTTYYHFKSTHPSLAQHYRPQEIAQGAVMEETPRVDLSQVPPEAIPKQQDSWATKDLTVWARTYLTERISALQPLQINDFTFTIIAEACNVSVEANVIYVRQKPRIGFELAVSVMFMVKQKEFFISVGICFSLLRIILLVSLCIHCVNFSASVIYLYIIYGFFFQNLAIAFRGVDESNIDGGEYELCYSQSSSELRLLAQSHVVPALQHVLTTFCSDLKLQ